MSSREAKWPFIVNLSNSIIGVSVLAMPFCMKQCGILLGTILLISCSLLTRLSCHFLFKGAYISRRKSYESFAFHVFGGLGKTAVETMSIAFLVSTLIAFFVIIGDLGPDVATSWLGLSIDMNELRVLVMIVMAVMVILPLSLLRNVESLSHISGLAILFYGVFVLRLFLISLPNLLNGKWWTEVNFFRSLGTFQCLPIMAMALSCQTQLFIMADALEDCIPAKMDSIVGGAVNLCSSVYLTVGIFGYIAFYDQNITGDILVLFDSTSFITQVIKLCFLLSVAVSFPLMIFPCRAAIYNMFNSSTESHEHFGSSNIPDSAFRLITVVVISFTLLVATIIPNVEFVLGLTGSLIGSLICFVIPATMFLGVGSKSQHWTRLAAKACLVLGSLILILGTYSTFKEASYETAHETVAENKLLEIEKMIPEKQADPLPILNKTVQAADKLVKDLKEHDQGGKKDGPGFRANK